MTQAHKLGNNVASHTAVIVSTHQVVYIYIALCRVDPVEIISVGYPRDHRNVSSALEVAYFVEGTASFGATYYVILTCMEIQS